MRRYGSVLALAAAAALLVGCTDEEPVPEHTMLQGSAPGVDSVELTEMPELEDPEITADDLSFVRHMVVHHGQALQMTELVPERTGRDDVPLFAERIQLSQEDEIRLMEQWLQDHRLTVLRLDQEAGGHGDHAEPTDMPGMITEEQLQRLRELEGEEFDRLFLELMYAHHEGAVQMVTELQQGDMSDDTVLWNLVREIDGDQRIEMDRILQMLAQMDGADATESTDEAGQTGP